MSERSFDPAAEPYVSLATFRRDGREVRTPVWIAAHDGRLYLFSEGGAGKVKRIRANGRARLAACDFKGRVRGGWLDARGRVVTEPEVVAAAYRALKAKYGWRMGIGDFFSRLTGRYPKRAILELDLNGAS